MGELTQFEPFKAASWGRFVKHTQENELLHNLFEFKPKRKQLLGNEHCISSDDKDSPLIIECFNFNNNGKHDLIGWHFAGTYDVTTKTGGPFRTMRHKLEQGHVANNGLEIAIRILEPIKE